MRSLFQRFVKALIVWLFRRRSPALVVMRIGATCLAFSLGAGFVMDVSIPFRDRRIDFSFDSGGAAPDLIVYSTVAISLAILVAGLTWEISRYRSECRRIARRKIIVIEARGLRDTGGSPLVDAVPTRLAGQRDHVLVDLRQRIRDGEIVAPEAALEDLNSLPADLRRRESGVDRRDLTLVYGGLAPVPLTFLTGVLIDDEGEAVILDWDRHAGTWRELDDLDDGKRFEIAGLISVVPGATDEVALAVSVSYKVIASDVRSVIGDIPLVELTLNGGSPDCHWSEEKQRALGQQFLDTAIDLSGRGVKRIHVFLAAQNSVAFRLGRLYDKRNLAEVVVYQYQRAKNPPYPWGILMPVCGIEQPVIIYN